MINLEDKVVQSTRQAFYFIEDIKLHDQSILEEDRILVYNNDVLVGLKQWGGNYSDVAVMGADEMLETDRYCEIGSNVTFKVFQESSGQYFHVVESVPKWDDNGLFILPSLNARVLPSETLVSAAYPNPFNPVTQITFGLEKDAHVRAVIYDVSGRVVEVLANNNFVSGYHNLFWSGDEESSGLYFLIINSEGVSTTQKLMLLK